MMRSAVSGELIEPEAGMQVPYFELTVRKVLYGGPLWMPAGRWYAAQASHPV